jgi:hypothetical protein
MLTHRPGSDPIVLAVCGEVLVGQALMLLLRDSRYDTRYLPVSSLNGSGALKGVRLVVLISTPQLSNERRTAVFASLRDQVAGTETPVLELVAFSDEPQDRETWAGPGRMVSWPCSIEELKRQIEVVLLDGSEEGLATCRGLHAQEEK